MKSTLRTTFQSNRSKKHKMKIISGTISQFRYTVFKVPPYTSPKNKVTVYNYTCKFLINETPANYKFSILEWWDLGLTDPSPPKIKNGDIVVAAGYRKTTYSKSKMQEKNFFEILCLACQRTKKIHHNSRSWKYNLFFFLIILSSFSFILFMILRGKDFSNLSSFDDILLNVTFIFLLPLSGYFFWKDMIKKYYARKKLSHYIKISNFFHL